jgi:hypothetical protein
MTLSRPVSAFIYPGQDNEQNDQSTKALGHYCDFLCSRLKIDAGSYRNASFFVSGAREKESLLALCEEKLADISALSRNCAAPSEFDSDTGHFEAPSYTQYVLDADYDLLLDITAIYHFSYRREYKTLEMFQHLEKATEWHDCKALIGKAVRLQQASILRLDSKAFADSPGESENFPVKPYPVLTL